MGAAPGRDGADVRTLRPLSELAFRRLPRPVLPALPAHPGGTLVGDLVTRLGEPVELPLGVVADIFAGPEDAATLDALLALANRTLASDAEPLEAAASHPAWQAALRRAGFIATRTMHPTIVCTDEDLRARLARTLDDWHFTKADHDWDRVHPV